MAVGQTETGARESILIVDNDESTCRTLELMLGKKGYETGTACTGLEAIERTRQKYFNLAILDIRVTDIDGIELLEPLQELHPDMEFILITGHASVETAVKALSRKVSAYQTKSLDLDELNLVIGEILEKQRLVREKRRAEKALIESEERYRVLLDSITDGVQLLDREFRCLLVNDGLARMMGVSKAEIPGKRITDLFPGIEDTAFFRTCREVIDTGTPGVVSDEFPFKDGQNAWFEVHVYPAPEGILVVSTDITQQRKAEQDHLNLQAQLQQAQKMESIGLLVGGIAHDFNNMLVSVLGKADLLLGMLPRTSAAYTYIEGIEKTAQRAADLAREMLIYSGKGKFVLEPVDVSGLVKEMACLIEASISKKISLEYDLADGIPAIEADPTQIRQVIVNLITNAAEAIGGEKGVITFVTGTVECDHGYLAETYLGEVLPEGLYVSMEVSDTGCGIDDETKLRIFDPFFTTKHEGRGLGLSIILGIIRSHGGTFRVYSEPGRGTSVKVLLPASGQAVEKMIPPDREEGNWSGEGTVLVIDDEDEVLEVADEMLTGFGFEVIKAKNGAQGVEVFRRYADDIVLVLLDWMMPDMDGMEVLYEISRIRGDVCVLLSSGYTEHDITQCMANRDFDGFIQKPYIRATLREKVREVMEV